jgi:hypothetical protein
MVAEQPPLSVWKAPEAAEGATVVEEPAKREPTALEKFAGENWKNLPARIAGAASSGKPEDVVDIIRNLPKDPENPKKTKYPDLQAALKELGRTDIQDAFDKMFNEYLHKNNGFLSFVRGRKNYSNIGYDAYRLSADSTQDQRTYVAEAVQEFVMDMTARKDDSRFALLKDDVKLLTGTVLGLKTDRLIKDGMPDMRTIAAVALVARRMANPNELVGAWADRLGVKVATPVPGQPAQQAKPPEEKESDRGRTIRIPL